MKISKDTYYESQYGGYKTHEVDKGSRINQQAIR